MDNPKESQPEASGVQEAEQKQPGIGRRVDRHIQGKMLAELLALFPLLATVAVLLFLVDHADSLIRPLPYVSGRPWDVTGIGLVVFVLLFYFVGLLISFTLGRRLMVLLRAIIGYIPVVKTIFGVTQQVSTTLTSQYNFSRVVFVEWPREGMAAMGFVTGRVYTQDQTSSMVVVYIPTVPNPTSGNMAFVQEDDIIETDLTVDAAMKLVFSGGIVLPDAFSLARVPRHLVEDQGGGGLIGRFETDR